MLSDLSILALALNATRDGSLLVLNALLEFENALLTILLLQLNVLHQIVENSFGLQTLLLGLALLLGLELKDLLLAIDRHFEFSGLDLGGNHVFFKTLQHVAISGLGQLLFFDFHGGLSVLLIQFIQARGNLEDGTLGLGLLHAQILYFLPDSIQLSLLVDADTLCVVVLLLDL